MTVVEREKAIEFWMLGQLIEGCNPDEPYDSTWEIVAQIVQQLHEVGLQLVEVDVQDKPALDTIGCPPPDPRLRDEQRPPRVPWGTVARAWAKVSRDQLTAAALRLLYSEILSQLQKAHKKASR